MFGVECADMKSAIILLLKRAAALSAVLLLAAAAQPARPEHTHGKKFVIAAFGDSLVAGYGLDDEQQSFAPVLQRELRGFGLNVTVINAGVPGETSAEGLARTEWMLEDKPDIVIVELGANDMLRGLPTEPLHNNLDAMVTKIKQSGAKVLLAGMLAGANLGAEYQTRFRKVYEDISLKHDVLLYPFFLEGVATIPELNQSDGKHPNEEGVKVIVRNISPWVAKLIAELH